MASGRTTRLRATTGLWWHNAKVEGQPKLHPKGDLQARRKPPPPVAQQSFWWPTTAKWSTPLRREDLKPAKDPAFRGGTTGVSVAQRQVGATTASEGETSVSGEGTPLRWQPTVLLVAQRQVKPQPSERETSGAKETAFRWHNSLWWQQQQVGPQTAIRRGGPPAAKETTGPPVAQQSSGGPTASGAQPQDAEGETSGSAKEPPPPFGHILVAQPSSEPQPHPKGDLRQRRNHRPPVGTKSLVATTALVATTRIRRVRPHRRAEGTTRLRWHNSLWWHNWQVVGHNRIPQGGDLRQRRKPTPPPVGATNGVLWWPQRPSGIHNPRIRKGDLTGSEGTTRRPLAQQSSGGTNSSGEPQPHPKGVRTSGSEGTTASGGTQVSGGTTAKLGAKPTASEGETLRQRRNPPASGMAQQSLGWHNGKWRPQPHPKGRPQAANGTTASVAQPSLGHNASGATTCIQGRPQASEGTHLRLPVVHNSSLVVQRQVEPTNRIRMGDLRPAKDTAPCGTQSLWWHNGKWSHNRIRRGDLQAAKEPPPPVAQQSLVAQRKWSHNLHREGEPQGKRRNSPPPVAQQSLVAHNAASEGRPQGSEGTTASGMAQGKQSLVASTQVEPQPHPKGGTSRASEGTTASVGQRLLVAQRQWSHNRKPEGEELRQAKEPPPPMAQQSSGAQNGKWATTAS
ncbi:uncharacterized protein LOC135201211 [Macrobrachium nipponense]|uniref:uncharacterized protein LOC135201211 n=1 Tax=Macrobrachium nipponense TaxID=159736 RepID=UPI0030C7CA19